MPKTVQSESAGTSRNGRKKLRVLGTEITLLEQIRRRAEADLGFEIEFEVLDFLSCQRRAALEPESYDIYDQCFHNLDIVWFWGSLQQIDTRRIAEWDRLTGLTREGGINKYAWRGHGDAPVRKLYVQPGEFLGPEPSRHISMLPTVHNFDSFGYDTRVFGNPGQQRESWAWLLDPRAKGRIALVDEPAIGIFDVALAAEAAGRLQFADIGNMTVAEIDALMSFLNDLRQQGFFRAVWRNAEEAGQLIRDEQVSAQSMWSPVYGALGAMADVVAEAAPLEGYRAWHGGLSLARHLSGAELGMAYDYLNWWLSGWPGSIMARQGYYMSVPGRVREQLAASEWDYWYEGAAAASDLPGPRGEAVVKAGARRSGGSYWQRASRIAVWNSAMDEHNYAARAWDRFASRVRGEAPQ
jgi:putative spermidine/putrescine transport system substrate-binding protein